MIRNIAILSLIIISQLFAQSTGQNYRLLKEKIVIDSVTVYNLSLKDGSDLRCTIVSFDSVKIDFKALSGWKGSVEFKQVKSISVLRGKWKEGIFIPYQPHSTHLLVSPTAYTLPAGKFYLSYSEFFFPLLTYSPADFFDFGGGMPIIPSSDFEGYYFYGKLSLFQQSGFSAAVGAILINIGENRNTAPFAVITMDNDKFLLNVGASGKIFNNSSIVTAGFEVRTAPRLSIVGEIWALSDDKYSYIGFSGRYRNINYGSDVGFILPWKDTLFDSGLIPWVAVHFYF